MKIFIEIESQSNSGKTVHLAFGEGETRRRPRIRTGFPHTRVCFNTRLNPKMPGALGTAPIFDSSHLRAQYVLELVDSRLSRQGASEIFSTVLACVLLDIIGTDLIDLQFAMDEIERTMLPPENEHAAILSLFPIPHNYRSPRVEGLPVDYRRWFQVAKHVPLPPPNERIEESESTHRYLRLFTLLWETAKAHRP